MQTGSFDTNPEYAFHYEQIRYMRASRRRRGYLLLVCASGLLALAISGIPYLLQKLSILPSLLLVIGVGVVFLTLGVLALRQGMNAISHEEVELLRNAERRQLFQYAQGAVPWWYRRTTIIIMLIYSILLMGLGALPLIYSIANLHKYGWAGSWFFIATGILFLVAGTYYLLRTVDRAKTAKKLAKLSSQELALRLELGEVTQGE